MQRNERFYCVRLNRNTVLKVDNKVLTAALPHFFKGNMQFICQICRYCFRYRRYYCKCVSGINFEVHDARYCEVINCTANVCFKIVFPLHLLHVEV